MKIKELVEILKQSDPEMEVVLFADGAWFPLLGTQEWEENGETYFELGGGWGEFNP